MEPTKETKKFRKWVLKNYGIQESQNVKGTQVEEFAVAYSESYAMEMMKGFYNYMLESNDYDPNWPMELKIESFLESINQQQ